MGIKRKKACFAPHFLVECSREDCNHSTYFQASTVTRAKDKAKEQGWRPDGKYGYHCPAHAAEVKPTEKQSEAAKADADKLAKWRKAAGEG